MNASDLVGSKHDRSNRFGDLDAMALKARRAHDSASLHCSPRGGLRDLTLNRSNGFNGWDTRAEGDMINDEFLDPRVRTKARHMASSEARSDLQTME